METSYRTPMQRVTLILLRLMLAFVIAVAVWGQFRSILLVVYSPIGVIQLAVCEFGVMLDYCDMGNSDWDIRYAMPVPEKRFIGAMIPNTATDGIYSDIFSARKLSLPGIVFGCGEIWVYLTSAPAYLAAIRHFWIIVPTLLLNVVAHLRVHRKTLRAKSLNPLANS